MIAITSVVNNNDGVSVNVTLATAPSGSLSINFTRNVAGEGSGATGSVTPTFVTGTTYKAVIGNLNQQGTPLPFQVSATDNTGTTGLYPVWVRYGTSTTFPLEVQTALQGILEAYAPHLNLYLASVASTQIPMTVQKIIANSMDSVKDYPAIAIDANQFTSDWYGLPLTRIVTTTALISCAFIHNTSTSYRDIVKALGQAVMDVLNQEQFTTIVLPSSVQLENCACTQMQVEEYFDGDRWVAMATITWGSQASWPEG